MSKWEFLLNLWDKMNKKYNGKIPLKGMVLLAGAIFIILVGFVVSQILDSGYFAQRWQRPVWDFQEEIGCDVIESDIELKAGDIVVTPQIEVRYDDKVVFIIDILYYYEENGTILNKNKDGEARQFTLFVRDFQREKMDALLQFVQETVKEKVREEDADKEKKLEFEVVKVVEINSQNMKANGAKTQYLCITDFEEDDIGAGEAAMRKTVFNINLDNYTMNGDEEDNAESMTVISACIEKILNLK